MSKLEQLVAEINSGINDQTKAIEAGKAPENFKALEKKVEAFTIEIANLDDEQKKQYIDILAVWAEQIRNISQKINLRMQEIQKDIEGAKNQAKVSQSYKYLDN